MKRMSMNGWNFAPCLGIGFFTKTYDDKLYTGVVHYIILPFLIINIGYVDFNTEEMVKQ